MALTPSQVRPGAPSVLVTGGRGFIGRHMVKNLASHGYRVVSVDIAPIEEGLLNPVVTEVLADVRDATAMQSVFASNPYEKVFDLASYTEVGLPASEYARNVDMTRVMVDLAAKSGVAKYIFYSTQFVFRKENELPQNETDYDPADNYGASKIESERLIRSGLPASSWLILRPTYIWGPGHARFRNGFLRRLAKGQLLIPSAASRLRRFYGYVETVVEQTRRFSDMDFATLPRRVFYLTDAPIEDLGTFCSHLTNAMGRGQARPVPRQLIELLGRVGGGAHALGLPFPINRIQSTEMTHSYPVPFELTIELTKAVTDLDYAAQQTVRWAMSDPEYVRGLG